MVRFTVYTGETQRQSQIYYNFEETNSSPQVHRKHTQLFMALTRKAAMDIGQSSQMLQHKVRTIETETVLVHQKKTYHPPTLNYKECWQK